MLSVQICLRGEGVPLHYRLRLRRNLPVFPNRHSPVREFRHLRKLDLPVQIIDIQDLIFFPALLEHIFLLLIEVIPELLDRFLLRGDGARLPALVEIAVFLAVFVL